MKNFKKKALLPAIIMVMVSVIALSSATYAWFTTGQEATVDHLEVKVVAASGIQFSLNAADWKSVITAEDIKDYGVLPTSEISPVSTNAKTNGNGRLNFFSATVSDNGDKLNSAEVLAPEESNGVLTPSAAGNYITFDLYVKVTTAAKLYLNSASAVTNKDGGDTRLATRVAFIDQGSAEDPETAMSLKTSNDQSAYVWEPNATEHATEALQVYGSALTQGAKATYKGLKAKSPDASTFDIPNNPNGDYDTALAPVTTNTEIGLRDEGMVAELGAGINKLTVTIWIEGQDHDCVNTVSGGKLDTFLKFIKEDIA